MKSRLVNSVTCESDNFIAYAPSNLGAITVNFHVNLERKLQEHKLPKLHDLPWHFTSSAVVIAAEHVLLIHHKRIGGWLPPGGHFEGKELPHQAAIRETLEETGVAVRVLSVARPASSDSSAFFLPQPICVQSCSAVEKGVELYHVDMAFLCTVDVSSDNKLPEIRQTEDVHEARWVALSDLGELPLAKNVPEIISMAQAMIKQAAP